MIRRIGSIVCACALGFIVLGCQTTHHGVKEKAGASQPETSRDVESALQAVTGTLSGQQIDEAGLRDLSRQIQKDEKARTAVEAVTGAIQGKEIKAKYCPLTGKHYSAELDLCPEDGAKLVPIEE